MSKRNPIARDLRSPTGKYRKRVEKLKTTYCRKAKHKENLDK